MDAAEIKTKILHYYRFKRRYLYIATEAGAFNSDVLVSDGKEVIEIEVKTSVQDLKNEFKKKKHRIYFNPLSRFHHEHTPNKFFFAVPEELIKTTKQLIDGRPYGIIKVNDSELTHRRKNCYCKIIKNAHPIRLQFPTKIHHSIILRLGSELIRCRMDTDPGTIKKLISYVRGIKKKIRGLGMSNPLDT